MKNKCPKCGFKYNQGDNFCAKCGHKIQEIDENLANIIKQFDTEKKAKNIKKSSFESGINKKNFDNMVFSVAILLITILCGLCILLFYIINKHHNHKDILHYKNLIKNPSQIPLLKETTEYDELALNWRKIEEFLLLYLNNSSDSIDKKEQIFATYLKELEKLPIVLNKNFTINEIVKK